MSDFDPRIPTEEAARRSQRLADAIAEVIENPPVVCATPTQCDGLTTPPWYAGDGMGASEALDSAAAQPTVCERPEKAFYWWALAFKYVWRMWSKADPKSDCAKARDCLARLEKRMGWSE